MSKAKIAYTLEEPPHKGWTIYLFAYRGRPWRMTVIDDGEKKESLFRPLDDLNRQPQPWPDYYIMTIPAILEPDHVAEIIDHVYVAYEHGLQAGIIQKQNEFKVCLGLIK